MSRRQLGWIWLFLAGAGLAIASIYGGPTDFFMTLSVMFLGLVVINP